MAKPKEFPFRDKNKNVTMHIYAVSDVHNYPMTTTYLMYVEGDIEYEFIDMVEYKHYYHVYWEVVYDFLMGLTEPYNITIISPSRIGFEKFSRYVKPRYEYQRTQKKMWLNMEKQILKMKHGFKSIRDTELQLDMITKINEYKRPRLERIRALKYLDSYEREKIKEGEYLFSFDPSEESHIEREYSFSFNLSQ